MEYRKVLFGHYCNQLHDGCFAHALLLQIKVQHKHHIKYWAQNFSLLEISTRFEKAPSRSFLQDILGTQL